MDVRCGKRANYNRQFGGHRQFAVPAVGKDKVLEIIRKAMDGSRQ